MFQAALWEPPGPIRCNLPAPIHYVLSHATLVASLWPGAPAQQTTSHRPFSTRSEAHEPGGMCPRGFVVDGEAVETRRGSIHPPSGAPLLGPQSCVADYPAPLVSPSEIKIGSAPGNKKKKP